MSVYLGTIAIRNRYVNFRPLYEYQGEKFLFISQYDRQAILPASEYGDINLYYEDSKLHIEEDFIDSEYRLIDVTEDILEDNYSNYGQRNPTGYKIEASKTEIKTLSDYGYYYKLTESGYEGSYRTNPTLTITDPNVYQGLQIVIPVTGESNLVVGPFTVEWSEKDTRFFIKTNLQNQKFILWGFAFPTYLSEYEIEIGKYGERRTFININSEICEEIPIDFIAKEQILSAFRDTLGKEHFVDGKLDFNQISQLIKTHENSLFIGDEIPESIQRKRFDELNNLLTDEERLNETFNFISSTITSLLEKYQGNDQYNNLVQSLADNPNFMSKIQRYQIISDRIDAKQAELKELTFLSEELQKQTKEEYASDMLGKFEVKIQELNSTKSNLESEIDKLNSELGNLKNATNVADKLQKLEADVSFKERRERELDDNIKKLEEKIDTIFSNSTEKAVSFAFDGMLSNRMIQQAAEWESNQSDTNYLEIINKLNGLKPSMLQGDKLLENLVQQVQLFRPNYDRNDILNIFICYTQGFLTVFSGEPGTGKTSICKILSSVLGLTVPEKTIQQNSLGVNVSRFLPVSVERGWTTKRDFIGYYNPLTKSFDRSNRKMYDALNILNLEANGNNTNMPFLILLDEANLSPMEYYWADYMNVCDDLDSNTTINLGDDFCFNVAEQLRFVATINNDHTTEALSPRLIDRAWIIRLPKVKSGAAKAVTSNSDSTSVVSWSSINQIFGSSQQKLTPMEDTTEVKVIYEELLIKFRVMKLNVSNRSDTAIRNYWSTAQRIFENDNGTDSSIIALDYAIAQKLLTHIDGSGEKYGSWLNELQIYCSEKNLSICSNILLDIIEGGKESMQYYRFFA